jgi:excisionase family DNA binding protein
MEGKAMSKAQGSPVSLPRLLTIKQVAAHTQFSTKQVRRWIAAGDLIATRIGRQWRIAENDFALFLSTFKGRF